MTGERDDDRDHAEGPPTAAEGGSDRARAPDGPLRAPSATVFPLSVLRGNSPGEAGPAERQDGGTGEPTRADAEKAPSVFPLSGSRQGHPDHEARDSDDAGELGASAAPGGEPGEATATTEGDERPQPETPPPAADGGGPGREQPSTLEEAQRSADALIALEQTILSLLKEPNRDAPKKPVEAPVFPVASQSAAGEPSLREIKIFRSPAAPAERAPSSLIRDAGFAGDGGPSLEHSSGGQPSTPPERILATREPPDDKMRVPFEIEPFLPKLVHEVDALPETEASEPAAARADDEPEGEAPHHPPADEGAAPHSGEAAPAAPAEPEPRPRPARDVEPARAWPTPVLVADNAGLAADGIGKRFKQRQVLRGVSLTLQRGEVVGLLGPNGAGKTTCFYIITGLISADYGNILLDGKDITSLPMYRRARLGIGYLPQEPSIFRGLNVENNIRSVLESVETERDAREAMLDDLLAEFSITHLRRTPALALSGGERRRVEIARALASQPNFILLDEPLAGIDPIALGDIRDLVAHLKDRGIGVLITDHNVRETLEIVDRAYIIYNGEVLMGGKPSEIVSHDDVRRVYLGDGFTL